jgi:hypothetical protein
MRLLIALSSFTNSPRGLTRRGKNVRGSVRYRNATQSSGSFGLPLALVGVLAWVLRGTLRGNWTLPRIITWGSFRDFRVLIVSIFEGVCIAFVIIPTLIALIAFAAVSAEHPLSGFILPALTFLVTAFLAGGVSYRGNHCS